MYPEQRREAVRGPEDDRYRRNVNDEHRENGAAEDARKVVVVRHDLLAEGGLELGLGRKDVEALDDD